MTDREYLEFAAKAAGGQVRFDLSPDEAPWLQSVVNGKPQPYPARWNPLTDDGDALRLMVALNLAVSVEANFGSTQVLWGPPVDQFRVMHDDDPYAATRRAIVRAAAEIGKGLT